jgi:hypothetical protein
MAKFARLLPKTQRSLATGPEISCAGQRRRLKKNQVREPFSLPTGSSITSLGKMQT